MGYNQNRIGAYQAGEMSVLMRPTKNVIGKNAKCLIYLHGRNGYAAKHLWSTPGLTAHLRKLVDVGGYWVLSADGGSQSGTTNGYGNLWNNDANLTAITNAKTHLLSTIGATGSARLGFLDYSLGGGQGFNWMSRNASLCAGVISYAPAADFDYFNANNPTANQEYKAEQELSYTTATRTLSGSGTLNQVGSTLTVTTDTTPFPASGTIVLHPATDRDTYLTLAGPLIVTYTSKNATQFLGCVIAVGSAAWNGAVTTAFNRVSLVGGYATNKATRSPLLIASNVVFDQVPVHCYSGLSDTLVPSAQVSGFCTAVGSNATYHPVAAPADHGNLFGFISSDEILSIVDKFAW